jgi:hypothetical protein
VNDELKRGWKEEVVIYSKGKQRKTFSEENGYPSRDSNGALLEHKSKALLLHHPDRYSEEDYASSTKDFLLYMHQTFQIPFRELNTIFLQYFSTVHKCGH